jgi:hypothetical protein
MAQCVRAEIALNVGAFATNCPALSIFAAMLDAVRYVGSASHGMTFVHAAVACQGLVRRKQRCVQGHTFEYDRGWAFVMYGRAVSRASRPAQLHPRWMQSFRLVGRWHARGHH